MSAAQTDLEETFSDGYRKSIIISRKTTDADEIEIVGGALGRHGATGLLVTPDIFTAAHRQQIIALAARYRLPAIYAYRYFAKDGGLMSYGIDPTDQCRQAAVYVDRILRGTTVGALPIQAPTKLHGTMRKTKHRGIAAVSADFMVVLREAD